MKTLKLLNSGFIIIFLMLSSCAVKQVNNQKAAEMEAILKTRNYVFVAESANPLSGGNIPLTSSYSLSIKGDSLDSHLPYYGTAYRAAFGSSVSPLTFTSTDFSYDPKISRNGNQVIVIKLNSPADPDMMTLSISPSGYGTLQVTSVDRQSITFYGYIRANDKLMM